MLVLPSMPLPDAFRLLPIMARRATQLGIRGDLWRNGIGRRMARKMAQ